MSRPILRLGSYGPDVGVVQTCLDVRPADNDFGNMTHDAVFVFQTENRLEADGIVGQATWNALDEQFDLPPYPPPILPPLDADTLASIAGLAKDSALARYEWDDRGQAPIGYISGMALAYATMYRKYVRGYSTAIECAKANTHDDDLDALSWYYFEFDELEMNNEKDGVDTLRHLFVLITGLGMRESSGRHCEGRDLSADNVTSDTAEAGLFQQSWNSNACNTEISKLLDEYADGLDGYVQQCALPMFEQGVSCSSSEWESYGSGDGLQFQEECKTCPQFAVEAAAIGLRNLRQHWGPINRREVELLLEADELFMSVEELLRTIEPLPPYPGPEPEPEVATVRISTTGPLRLFVNGIEVVLKSSTPAAM